MEEQSNKLQNLRESANQAFEEVFSNPFKKKETGSSEALYHDDVIVISPDHKIIFPNTKSMIANPLPNYGAWTKLDWSNKNINWLSNSTFKADAIQIEGKGSSRAITSVKNCLFESGNFRGGKFIRGKFAGDSFVGQFGPGAEWLTTPFAFVDGTTKESETILGQKNMKIFNQNKFEFNIIRVLPGSKITIQLKDGTVHEIAVIKRLDDKNSIFQFQVKNGITKEVFKLAVKWPYLRGNTKGEFVSNTVFSNTQIPVLFKEKFKLDFTSSVIKVVVDENTSYEPEVVTAGGEKEMSPEELAAHQESFELIKAPLFGIKDIPGQPIAIKGKRGQYKNNLGKVFFNFTNNDQLKGYKDTVKNLENKILRADLTTLKSALKNNVLDGAPAKYPYLSNLIGPASKEKEKSVLDQNLDGSMFRIESMLKNFVDTMVLKVRKKDGIHDVSNDEVKNMAKSGIKRFLGIEDENQPVVPGASSAASNKTNPVKKKARTLQEAVREIISQNLEHF